MTDTYQTRKDQLVRQLQTLEEGERVRLKKETSNLFRHYRPSAEKELNVKDFKHVLNVTDTYIEVEGMTPYYDVVKTSLKHNVMPAVVPQLRSITVGGAVSGVGIESSSFKYGLVHETVREMDILTGRGDVVTATPDGEHKDLFFGFPNSYGTLGYALKLKIQAVPVLPYVHITHIRYDSYPELIEGIQSWAERTDIDFLDGVIFSQNEMYLSIGSFTDAAPYTSDYTYKNMYYASIREKTEDYLTVHDYIWRWDTDWFWCSKNLYMHNPIVRTLMGKKRLNSVTYTKIMRWNNKWDVTGKIDTLLGYHSESVIQDVDIPVQNLEVFLEFFEKEIGIFPAWVCPTKRYDSSVEYPLFPMKADTLYVNVGFWDTIRERTKHPDGYYNKKVEQKVGELGGVKSLYSSVYYDKETFWSIYNKEAYDALKETYDPNGRRKDLYETIVRV